MNKRVAILPTKYVSDEHIALTQSVIKVIFNMDSYVIISTGLKELGTYNIYRGQYDAISILNQLSAVKTILPAADRVVGLINDDMYKDGSTFVYGLAWCPGDAAVISLKRLHGEHQPINNTLMRERLLKIVYHELAHTYGLKHCENNCVLHTAGGNIADVDYKLDIDLCATCKAMQGRID